MKKRHSKFHNNIQIVFGLLLIFLAIGLYDQIRSQPIKPNNPEVLSIESNTINKPTVNNKVDSFSALCDAFNQINVGEKDDGAGGSKKSQVVNLLGKPDSKAEDYYSGEKVISYSWNYFPWDDPVNLILVSFKNGKVISRTMTISQKNREDKPGFSEEFDRMVQGEEYSKEDIIEKLGYPTTEMTLRDSNHRYDHFMWGSSKVIYSIELKDGKLKGRTQNVR